MTTDARFQILMSGLALIFVVMSATLGFVIRATTRWVRAEVRLEEVGKDIRELVESKDKIHGEMINTMTGDRKATDERLRHLEREVWANPMRRRFGFR